ncbi:Nn.00g006130.m01.CDS01 [Neocucurbitaria sp. VM-36]
MARSIEIPQSEQPVDSSAPIDANRDIEAAATHSPAKPPQGWNALKPGFHDRPPFKRWVRQNWSDIATQLLCLLTAFLIYTLAPPLLPRYFPLYPGIERSSFGRKYGQPYIGEYITTIVSAVVSFAVPAAIMGAIGLWGTRQFADGNAAVSSHITCPPAYPVDTSAYTSTKPRTLLTPTQQLIGLGYALATATLFQSFIKILIGGLRPHFLSICAPSIPPSTPGLTTPGPSTHLYYTASQVCTGNAAKVKEAQMSFPSGHACAAFAGFVFLALYLNAKFKVFGRGRRSGFPSNPSEEVYNANLDVVSDGQLGDGGRRGRIQHWKLVVFAAPWCVAVLLAGSKIRDG